MSPYPTEMIEPSESLTASRVKPEAVPELVHKTPLVPQLVSTAPSALALVDARLEPTKNMTGKRVKSFLIFTVSPSEHFLGH
jgi:hypothetical protein